MMLITLLKENYSVFLEYKSRAMQGYAELLDTVNETSVLEIVNRYPQKNVFYDFENEEKFFRFPNETFTLHK